MTAKKLLQIISTILVALVVLLAVALVGVRLAGIRTFTVLSGSMEPTYHVGSLIYVKKVDSAAIRPGQVITFMLDENTVATHRVVEVVPDEDDPSTLRFRTKGDANDAEDGSLVHRAAAAESTAAQSTPCTPHWAHRRRRCGSTGSSAHTARRSQRPRTRPQTRAQTRRRARRRAG